MNCDLNITGECNGELKCCALNACEHGSLCVCVCVCVRANVLVATGIVKKQALGCVVFRAW